MFILGGGLPGLRVLGNNQKWTVVAANLATFLLPASPRMVFGAFARLPRYPFVRDGHSLSDHPVTGHSKPRTRRRWQAPGRLLLGRRCHDSSVLRMDCAAIPEFPRSSSRAVVFHCLLPRRRPRPRRLAVITGNHQLSAPQSFLQIERPAERARMFTVGRHIDARQRRTIRRRQALPSVLLIVFSHI